MPEQTQTIERRFVTTELRVDGEGKSKKLVGHAAVFNTFSQDLGGFREIIRPGAFTRTIAENADVRALFNHDPNYVLGRSKSGTLRMREDTRGLFYEVDLPDTQAGRDVAESVRRGDVSGSSFAFRAITDEWRTENGSDIRELRDVDLFDVSPVTYPAYPAADVAARSYDAWKQKGDAAIVAAAARMRQLRSRAQSI
jgi:HK97 family phage prohead protease